MVSPLCVYVCVHGFLCVSVSVCVSRLSHLPCRNLKLSLTEFVIIFYNPIGCGMKLRGDDPTSMKDFVLSIQNSVNEAKSLTESRQDGKPKLNSKRVSMYASL